MMTIMYRLDLVGVTAGSVPSAGHEDYSYGNGGYEDYSRRLRPLPVKLNTWRIWMFFDSDKGIFVGKGWGKSYHSKTKLFAG